MEFSFFFSFFFFPPQSYLCGTNRGKGVGRGVLNGWVGGRFNTPFFLTGLGCTCTNLLIFFMYFSLFITIYIFLPASADGRTSENT